SRSWRWEDLRRFGDTVDVDDGEVAEEEHGDRHDEAGDLTKQGSDQGGGGPSVGWRGSADRKDALQHLPGPVVARIERRPADVEGGRTRGRGRLGESRVHEQEDQGEGESRGPATDDHGEPRGRRMAEAGA